MKILNKNKHYAVKIIISIFVVVVLVGVSWFIIRKTHDSIAGGVGTQDQPSNTSNQKQVDTSSSASSTNGEASAGNTAKTDTSDPAAPNINSSIVIVDSTEYGSVFEVRAYISAISSGTCSYSFTKNSQPTVSKQNAATANTSNTSCATLDVPVSEFSSTGQWILSITYRSSDGQFSAASSPKTITIN